MKHRIGEVEHQYKGLNLLLINLNTNSGLSSLHLLREQHETRNQNLHPHLRGSRGVPYHI